MTRRCRRRSRANTATRSASHKPVIAAVNGVAAGLGLSYMLFYDMRIASERARFGTVFSRRGLIAEHGSAWLLPRLIGMAQRLRPAVLRPPDRRRGGVADGPRQSRRAARRLAAATVRDVATEMATLCSPRSIRIMKQQLYGDLFADLARSMRDADRGMVESFATEDFREGVASFVSAARRASPAAEPPTEESMITLYQFEISPFCDKVRRILNVKRVPYRDRGGAAVEDDLDGAQAEPGGQAALDQRRRPHVADSTDIAYYLDERYPEPRLSPPIRTSARSATCSRTGPTRASTSTRCGCASPCRTTRAASAGARQARARAGAAHRAAGDAGSAAPHGRQPGHRPEADRDACCATSSATSMPSRICSGDNAWLLGDRLTLADIAVFAQLFCIRASDEGGAWSETARVAAWLDRVAATTAPHGDDDEPSGRRPRRRAR